MKQFHFEEAAPLIDFLEKNAHHIEGQTLVSLYTGYWPLKGRYSMSDRPIILELEGYCIVVYYFLISDLTIEIWPKEEIRASDDLSDVLQIKDYTEDYYSEEFECGEDKENIEGRIITKISIERFSSEFECDLAGNTRPEGGDYFSTIRICLDSGKTLCICGEPAESDLWVDIWCE